MSEKPYDPWEELQSRCSSLFSQIEHARQLHNSGAGIKSPRAFATQLSMVNIDVRCITLALQRIFDMEAQQHLKRVRKAERSAQ